MDHVALVPCQHCLVRRLVWAAIVRSLLAVRRVLLGVATVSHLVQAALHVMTGDASDLVGLRVEVVRHLDLTLCGIVVDLELWHTMTQRNRCALIGCSMLVGTSSRKEILSRSRITRRELTWDL